MNKLAKYLKISVLLISATSISAFAMDGRVSDTEIARVDLLPGWRVDETTHMAGIRVRLAHGWHTYWRQPGDAGIPPQIGWAGSENVSNARLHFPQPEMLDLNGMVSLGYSDEVVLPLELTSSGAGAMRLQGQLRIGVCADVCIPMEFTIGAALPSTGAGNKDIENSLAQRPQDAAAIGLARARCDANPISDGLQISVTVDKASAGPSRRVVIETSDSDMWVSEPILTETSSELQAVAELVPANAKPFILDRSGVRVTVFGEGGAVEFLGCRTAN